MKPGLYKGRSSRTCENKKRRMKKWYNHILNNRQEKNKKGQDKKPLQPLSFFIDKIKISNQGTK